MVADELTGIDGRRIDPAVLYGKAMLVVNVASKCGLTPQYEGLERLQKCYGEAGFTVPGVPCNQFAGQEPGTPDEIHRFCSDTYGASFPMTEKLEANGRRRHPLYEWLTAAPDVDGRAGEVEEFREVPDLAGWRGRRAVPSAGQARRRSGHTHDRACSSMTRGPVSVKATEVRVGDRIRSRSGAEPTVTRIDQEFMGRSNMLAFVEDSEERWFKLPALRDSDVELGGRDRTTD